MYGITPTNALTINVYSLENPLVREFSSQVACAKWLEVSDYTVRHYIKSGKVFRKKYLIVRSSSPPYKKGKVLITLLFLPVWVAFPPFNVFFLSTRLS